MSSERPFDLVLFGATGFVGHYAVRELVQSIDSNPGEYSTLRWAVAGRNVSKLIETLQQIGAEFARDLILEVGIIEATVEDVDSLKRMAQSTTVLLNAVGPYALYGRPVVEACVRAGTHHLDMSAELDWNDQMEKEYHLEAEKSRCLVISPCGWASVISEISVAYMQRHFEGTLHSIETSISCKLGKHGYTLHAGTFHSILYHFLRIFRWPFRDLRGRMFGSTLPDGLPKSRIKQRCWPVRFPFFCAHVKGGGQVSASMGIDGVIHGRTQQYNYEHHHERPMQLQMYCLPKYWRVNMAVSSIALFALCAPGRAILNRNLELLSCGFISPRGPTKEQVDSCTFSFRLVGRGWSEQCADPNLEPKGGLNKTVILKVCGGEPAYVTTSCCLIQCGLTLIKEPDSVPRGGVLTPGAVFRDTKLTQRLQSRGITLEMEKELDNA